MKIHLNTSPPLSHVQLKTIPEDFVVEEIATHDVSERGPYTLFSLKKRNMTTESAISLLSETLKIPRRFFGYSGTKDARAVTVQYATVKTAPERIEKFKHRDMSVKVIGSKKEPLGLGQLKGNKFHIICRKLSKEKIREIDQIPNYFDEQRFSKNNVEIGRHIVNGRFQEAAMLVDDNRVQRYLKENPKDAVGALRALPKNTLLFYVHSFQSALFNEVLTEYLQQDSDTELVDGPVPFILPSRKMLNVSIPLIGFDTKLYDPFKKWYEEILERENITQEAFVIRAIPFLTLEGGEREAFIPINDIEIGKREPDELYEGFEKQKLSFTLQKGSYATMAVKCLYGVGNAKF